MAVGLPPLIVGAAPAMSPDVSPLAFVNLADTRLDNEFRDEWWDRDGLRK